jgi:hypothetical protein
VIYYGMARKPTPKPDDPAEYQRFVETARKLGADETPGTLDRAFKKVDLKKKPAPVRQK